MSKFTTPAILKLLPRREFEVMEDFKFWTDNPKSPECKYISVESGFITDLASIPRIFWPIFSPIDEYAKAAIIHDRLYRKSNTCYSRKESDDIFLEGMSVLRVSPWRKYAVYYAVRAFGWTSFHKK